MSITVEAPPQVKKRGRPRKNSLPTATGSPPSVASPVSPGYQNGHTPINKGHISSILNTDPIPLSTQPSPSTTPNGTHSGDAPKKKRGRPRKNDPTTSLKKENQVESESRRISSRPKKHTNGIIESSALSTILNSPEANQMTLLAFAAAEISEPESPKRKRGRPKIRDYASPSPSPSRSRSRSSSESRSRSPVQVPEIPKEKRKRGRPRKHFPPPNEIVKPKATGPPKKKGRKPKSETTRVAASSVSASFNYSNGKVQSKEESDELLYYKIVTTERSPGKRKIKPYDGIVGAGEDVSRISDGEESPDTDFEESSDEDDESEDSDSADDDYE